VIKTTIATTILKQLGGNNFIAMTGAKNFLDIGNGLSFKIPKSKNGINYVKIILNPNDTYDIEFGRISSGKYGYKVIKRVYDVYFDQLHDIFTTYTGLDTHL